MNETPAVPFPRCTYRLWEQAHPRTCQECGLGPCKAGLKPPSAAAETPQQMTPPVCAECGHLISGRPNGCYSKWCPIVKPTYIVAETPAGSETQDMIKQLRRQAQFTHSITDRKFPLQSLFEWRVADALTAAQKELERVAKAVNPFHAGEVFVPGIVEAIRRRDTECLAARKERDALMEQFDAVGLFIQASRDSGKTWQKWSLSERVRMAIGVCMDDDEAKQLETLESELAAERGRREEAEREAKRWKESDRCNAENFRVTNAALVKYDRERLDAIAQKEQAEARAAELEKAAERVVAFDWSDNDDDAVRAIQELDAALASRPAKGGQG